MSVPTWVVTDDKGNVIETYRGYDLKPKPNWKKLEDHSKISELSIENRKFRFKEGKLVEKPVCRVKTDKTTLVADGKDTVTIRVEGNSDTGKVRLRIGSQLIEAPVEEDIEVSHVLDENILIRVEDDNVFTPHKSKTVLALAPSEDLDESQSCKQTK